ncbi:flagellar protein FliO [mine drainage metagenome]|uniref:Flagellar protein FliO n=1 Tax=mine drainage metagenome TaxID=410659 RepID=A0A1J5RB85_9ZZZZ
MKLRVSRLLPWAIAVPRLAVAETARTPELGTTLVQMLLGLGVVLLLLFVSLYLLKRLTAPRGSAAGLLRVVAGTAVGTRERVVVLEVDDTWLVLGVTATNITPLTQLPRRQVPPTAASSKDFGGWLKQVMDRRNAP